MNSLFNLARVVTATTGTGTITLGAAVASFLTFAQAGVTDGAVVTYAIEDVNGGREVGTGTYTLSGLTLTRTTVYRSTGAGNTGKITLSGNAQVFITAAAEDLTLLQRTNAVRNNSMRGVVAGSPGTLPTNWAIVNSFGALTRTIVGVGTENGVDYIDIRFNGTTNNTSATLGWESGTQVAAIAGETFVHSAYLSIVAGALTNVTALDIGWFTNTSGGAFVGNSGTSILATLSGTQQRLSNLASISGGTVAFLWPRLSFAWTSGVAIDFTIRIGGPQVEKIVNTTFSYSSPLIRTVDAAVSRLADGVLSPYTPQQSFQLVDLVAAVTDVTGSTGTGDLVLGTSPTLVTPALGTPASGVATNLTGTAAGLTAGSVTTNANLTGNVTSVGNATTIAAGVVTNAMLAGSIAASKLVGSDIATVGTIGTGTWQGGVVAGQYGGSGVANTGKTITLGGNFVTSGAFATTLTVGATTNVTLPASGTLATLSGTETLAGKTLTTPIIGAATGTSLALSAGMGLNGAGLPIGTSNALAIPNANPIYGKGILDLAGNSYYDNPNYKYIGNNAAGMIRLGVDADWSIQFYKAANNASGAGATASLSQAAGVTSNGDFIVGSGSALATTATGGFLTIPSCNGAPTGVPTYAGISRMQLVFNTANNHLYVYQGGWKTQAGAFV